jgi:hypothetical protein
MDFVKSAIELLVCLIFLLLIPVNSANINLLSLASSHSSLNAILNASQIAMLSLGMIWYHVLASSS